MNAANAAVPELIVDEPQTLRIVPQTLRIVPQTLRIVPQTLRIVPQTLRIVPQTLAELAAEWAEQLERCRAAEAVAGFWDGVGAELQEGA